MSPISKTMLERYLRGECSAQEEEQVRHWLDMDDLEQYPPVLSRREYTRKERRLWRRLSSHLQHDGMKPVPVFYRFSRLLPYAAALLLLLTIGFLIWEQAGERFRWNGTVYATGPGEIKRVRLPDGTEVMLNSMSEISIRGDFGEEDRSVYLEGEGYFLVAGDVSRAFIVYSNDIATTALGTIFNISAYPDAGKTIVSLQEGSVSVNRTLQAAQNGPPLVLEPGEEVVCPGSGAFRRQVFDKRERLGWKDHVIYFDRAALPDVVRQLERYYGVRFDYRQLEGERWELTGEYHHVPLKDILESLSFNYGIQYEIEDNEVTLFK